MDQEFENKSSGGKPLKIVDESRQRKKGVVASSLQEIVVRARDKFEISSNCRVKMVLEQDGTEVDDDEYFSTMDANTILMVLVDDERWLPVGKFPSCKEIPKGDQTDSITPQSELKGLVDQLQGNLSYISMLSGKELELLTDMDPNNLEDIIPDRKFLEQVKEASSRFLSEKRQAQEAMELLDMYHKHHEKGHKKEKV